MPIIFPYDRILTLPKGTVHIDSGGYAFFPFASRIAFSSLADHFRHRQKIVGF